MRNPSRRAQLGVVLKSPAFALLSALAAASFPDPASAQSTPDCSSLGGNILYGVGGSAQTPLIGQIAARLRETANPDDQLTIVYSQPGACKAMDVFNPDADAEDRLITGTAFYWAAGNPTTTRNCNLPAEGLTPDFGTMQQFPEFCPGVEALPEGLGDFRSAIGTVNLIVPIASTQSSISAEALYFLFKFGAAGEVEPWTNENVLVRRNTSSAVQLYLAAAAGVNPDITFGWDAGTNGASVQAVATAETPLGTGTPEEAIGFVSGENAENNRDRVRTLAYQHTGQECAYWPDSSSTATDKLNVRTGRYFLWGQIHFYTPVDEEGEPTNELAGKLASYFTGGETPPELPFLNVLIDNYNVPLCAMQVQRDEDLGAISSYQPEEPCGCYFEERATGRTSCEECETSDDCPDSDPVCRHGFCEVQ